MPKYPGRIVSAAPPSVSLSGASGVWTLEEVAQYEQAGTWPVATGGNDPYFNQTVLLLHGDGTNGAQNNTFLDSSTNNFTITRNPATGPNAPTQGTFSPFSAEPGKWSVNFTGSNYFTVPDSAGLEIGSSNFTIECWFYPTAVGNYAFITKDAPSGTRSYGFIAFNDSGVLKTTFFIAGGAQLNSTATLNINAWNFVAVTRSGNTLYISVNGTVNSGSWTSTIPDNGQATWIGAQNGPGTIGNYAVGHISNLRLVIGESVASYQSNFTPPTSPASQTSGGVTAGNTKLLVCQSNRFVDNAATPSIITTTGSPRVTPFSPFAPTAAYSAGTNGGSGYFDGTSDYLSLPTSQQIVPATGDLTIEGWFYPTSLSADALLYTQTNGGASAGRFNFQVLSSGALHFQVGSASYTGTSGVVRVGQWNHLAVTRTGTSVAFYVNGATAGSGTVSGTIDTGSSIAALNRAADGSASSVPAYYGSFRISDSVRSSLTTVPTAPFTSDGNTKLLCNFTNAGILDQTSKNVLETVGNAQIDTAVKKYGTGSMKFDGNGDCLIVPSSVDTTLGLGDFTIEFWFYTATSQTGNLFDQRSTGTQVTPVLYLNSGVLIYYVNLGARITGSSVPTNQWNHVAVCRAGTSTKMFLNGVQTGSTYTDSNNYVAAPIGIGAYPVDASSPFNGYIDDLRITKGVARYPTEPFPTAPFPDL